MDAFDMSEVVEMAQELFGADGPVRAEGRKILENGANKTRRRAWNLLKTNRAYTQHYPSSFTYEMLNDGMAVEIGPEIGRKQAFLGKILEDGTSTSPPKPHLIPAAEAEAPAIAAFVEDAAVDALIGRLGGR